MTGVLMLAPSSGLGGGIERYVQTLAWAFAAQGITHQRVDLSRPGPGGHLRLLSQASACVAEWPEPFSVVAAHRALLPVASLLAARHHVRGISVICHGSDVWGARLRPRWYAESHLMRRRDVRVVAVSSFTAGALFPGCLATVLPPGLSRDWFDELAGAAARGTTSRAGIQLVTTLRLSDWRDKGVPQLVAAVAALGRTDVSLTICGSGNSPAGLLALARAHPWCTIRADLTDAELASQLAAADLFVLATRTRPGQRACGEGFGLVLLEAQLAGTPVVGPAHGGSRDAYLDRITGAAPTDETAAALTEVLERLLKDPAQLREMGVRAAQWARENFAPDRYAVQVVDRVL